MKDQKKKKVLDKTCIRTWKDVHHHMERCQCTSCPGKLRLSAKVYWLFTFLIRMIVLRANWIKLLATAQRNMWQFFSRLENKERNLAYADIMSSHSFGNDCCFIFPASQCPRYHDGRGAGVCHPDKHYRQTTIWPGELAALTFLMQCVFMYSIYILEAHTKRWPVAQTETNDPVYS